MIDEFDGVDEVLDPYRLAVMFIRVRRLSALRMFIAQSFHDSALAAGQVWCGVLVLSLNGLVAYVLAHRLPRGKLAKIWHRRISESLGAGARHHDSEWSGR